MSTSLFEKLDFWNKGRVGWGWGNLSLPNKSERKGYKTNFTLVRSTANRLLV